MYIHVNTEPDPNGAQPDPSGALSVYTPSSCTWGAHTPTNHAQNHSKIDDYFQFRVGM